MAKETDSIQSINQCDNNWSVETVIEDLNNLVIYCTVTTIIIFYGRDASQLSAFRAVQNNYNNQNINAMH